MQSSHSRTSRFLQTLKNAVFGNNSTTNSLGYETETSTPKPDPSNGHSKDTVQALHDTDRSTETPKLDRGQQYINKGTSAEPKWVKPPGVENKTCFGRLYEGTSGEASQRYYFYTDQNLVVLAIEGHECMLLDYHEVQDLASLLNELLAHELFNVIQFFENGTQEQVRTFVPAEEAVEAFKHYTNNVASRIGTTKRVIITDQLDCTNAEWIHGQGVVFPKPS